MAMQPEGAREKESVQDARVRCLCSVDKVMKPWLEEEGVSGA